MKRLILPALLLFGISLFSSCAKKDNAPANNSPTNSMTASLAPGGTWTAKTFSATANTVDITVTATSSDGSYMKFVLPGNVPAGTYQLTETGSYSYQYVTLVTSYLVKSGSITIISYSNKVMKATFTASISGNAGTIAVTNGSFTALF